MEFVAGVVGEEGCYVAETLGEGWGGEEWILALAEVVVIEVDGHGEDVDRQRVRERGLEVAGAGAFVDSFLAGAGFGAAAVLRFATGLPGVLAGFTADLGLGLRPDEGGEAFRDACRFNKVVGYVDEELESEAEAVFDEAGGDEDGLCFSEGRVAMTDGAVTEVDGVGGGDHDFTGVGDGEGHEVVGAALEGGGEGGWDGAYEALEVGVGDAVLAPCGVVKTVCGLGYGDLRGHLFRVPKIDLCASAH